MEKITFTTYSYDHPTREISSLDAFRLSNYLCDVIIVSKDGRRFPAHRLILASASPFFRTMFRESFLVGDKTEVAIGNVDGTVTKMLVEYAYTGETECPASIENVLPLYEASHYVQFDGLFKLCSEWLKVHVDVPNCLSLAIDAERYGDSDIVRACDRVAAVNIALLAEGEEFLSLSVERLCRIMPHDDLGVKSENDVLIILQKWIKHDEESRRDHLETLSEFVRFPLIDFQESSDVLLDLDLVSHYHSSHGPSRFRFGCDGVLLVAGGKYAKSNAVRASECSDVPFAKGYMTTSECLIYDANSDAWTTFPSLTVETCNHKMVTSYDVPYVLGGNNGCRFFGGEDYPYTAVVQRYDAERRQWVDDVKPMSRERNDFEIVGCGNHIYGMTIDWKGKFCEVFNPEKQTWTSVSSPRDSFENGCVLGSIEGRVYAIGCLSAHGNLGFMKYDPLEDRWCDFKSSSFPAYSGGIYDPKNSNLSTIFSPYHCKYVTSENRLYISVWESNSAAIFDGRTERFFVVDSFFDYPFERTSGLAYDPNTKRMYSVCPPGIAVYDERVNRWDCRAFEGSSLRKFDCAVVDRNLMA